MRVCVRAKWQDSEDSLYQPPHLLSRGAFAGGMRRGSSYMRRGVALVPFLSQRASTCLATTRSAVSFWIDRWADVTDAGSRFGFTRAVLPHRYPPEPAWIAAYSSPSLLCTRPQEHKKLWMTRGAEAAGGELGALAERLLESQDCGLRYSTPHISTSASGLDDVLPCLHAF